MACVLHCMGFEDAGHQIPCAGPNVLAPLSRADLGPQNHTACLNILIRFQAILHESPCAIDNLRAGFYRQALAARELMGHHLDIGPGTSMTACRS